MHLNVLAQYMKTAGDASRIRIICYLMRSGEVCVSDIARDLKMSVATTSHHLQVMAKEELVTPVRNGKRVCYKLPKTALMNGLKKFICTYANI
jgi:DNA-binding transcriptional ArsR family regulator